MQYLFFLIGLALSVRFAHKLSGLLWLWWRKEYRLDRMAIHIRTKQGRSLYASKSDWLFGALLVVYFVGYEFLAQIGMGIVASVLAAHYILHAKSSWYLPPPTPKIVASCALFIICIAVSVFYNAPLILVLVLLDVLMFPISIPIVFLLGVPTRLYHMFVIGRAISKLREHTPMTVIGITGSYGKTSVKDYLSTILSTKYTTLKTQYSKNSPIGIAEVINDRLTNDIRAFVVEMGAYKRGEIAEMARMVRPEIGIVTAVNPQHQDLFRTIETTASAKYELIEGLTGKKIAIVNWDNPYTKAMGVKARANGSTVYWWTTKESKNREFLYRATHINATIRGISFDVHYGKEKVSVSAPVLGTHQAGNLLAAMIAARCAGLTLKEAAQAASQVEPADKVMQVETGIHASLFINDTFNNNPDAAKAAISFMSQHKGKKYLVFQPMIELGTFAEKAHEEVGKVAGSVCDAVILTNMNYHEAFTKGVRESSMTVPVKVLSPEAAASYIREHVHQDDMVLFKGKDAEHTLIQLRNA